MSLSFHTNEVILSRLFFHRRISASRMVNFSMRFGRTVITARDGRRIVITAPLIDPILLRSLLLKICPSAEFLWGKGTGGCSS